MTVEQLIEELLKHDLDKPVLVSMRFQYQSFITTYDPDKYLKDIDEGLILFSITDNS